MTKARDIAGFDYFPGRNLLYNGAMQIHQRGTSASGAATNNYYTADRWLAQFATQGIWTQSVENDAPTGSGLRKSLKMLCTTADASPAAGDYVLITQALEGQDCQRIAKGTSAAQPLTLSFWVKSNVTGTYIAELSEIDNSRRISAAYTISASATWERKTITFPADTTGAIDNDNAASLYTVFWLGAGSDVSGGSPLQTTWGTATNTRCTGQVNLAASVNNYWQVTGVQLEVGTSATPFEFKPYGQELRECSRYYTTVGVLVSTSAWTTNVDTITFPKMRTTPTSITTSLDGGSNGSFSILSDSSAYQSVANTTNTSGTIRISAEL